VGRTSAAFAELVKEVAFIIAPDVDVSLGFESGTEGSLKLNAWLKGATTTPGGRVGLLAIIVIVAGWLTGDLRQYGFNKFLDHYFAPEQRNQLSDEDVERIVARLRRVTEGKIAKPQAQEFYREVERNESILHVGTITKRDAKPIEPFRANSSRSGPELCRLSRQPRPPARRSRAND
jgi:hypothetical protein